MNMKRKPDPFEQILRQASKSNNQDDHTKTSIKHKGKETQIIEQKRNIEWREDPDNPGMMSPFTISEKVYSLDDNGRPLDNTNDASGCKYGCIVRRDSLYTCAYCKRSICQIHAVFVGRKKYCKTGFCSVLGRTHKVLWLVYRFGKFCLRAVTAIGIDDEDSGTEEDLFSSSEDDRYSLVDEERL